MKYTKEINKVYEKFIKDFNRRDETFGMGTIKSLVKQLEEGNYNTFKYTSEDAELICKFLVDQYIEWMDERYKKLNSKEYKESHPWY